VINLRHVAMRLGQVSLELEGLYLAPGYHLEEEEIMPIFRAKSESICVGRPTSFGDEEVK
jgi:hypothetical protein